MLGQAAEYLGQQITVDGTPLADVIEGMRVPQDEYVGEFISNRNIARLVSEAKIDKRSVIKVSPSLAKSQLWLKGNQEKWNNIHALYAEKHSSKFWNNSQAIKMFSDRVLRQMRKPYPHDVKLDRKRCEVDTWERCDDYIWDWETETMTGVGCTTESEEWCYMVTPLEEVVEILNDMGETFGEGLEDIIEEAVVSSEASRWVEENSGKYEDIEREYESKVEDQWYEHADEASQWVEKAVGEIEEFLTRVGQDYERIQTERDDAFAAQWEQDLPEATAALEATVAEAQTKLE